MKLLGIDYGKSKIGIAVGDTVTRLVEPMKTVPNVQFITALGGIPPTGGTIYNLQKIINDQNIQKIIIGMPGGKMDKEIKGFGEGLKKQTGVEIEYFDETLTTHDAQNLLSQSGKNRKKRKSMEDAVAAALVLQYYLEARLC